MRAMSLRRLAALCCACAVLAAVVLCRVYWIGTDTAYAASAGGQSASLTELPQRRGDFYDRSGPAADRHGPALVRAVHPRGRQLCDVVPVCSVCCTGRTV